MYNTPRLILKYFHYFITASSGKGHGIHSPFVFDFIQHVLRDNRADACYEKIETRRKALQKDLRIIQVEDLGAGSSIIKKSKRRVSEIAGSSLKSAKYAQLLFRIVKHYLPGTIIELGTSFGLTTAYLATGNPDSKVFTIEGSSAIANIAREGLAGLGLQNIGIVEGEFLQSLPMVLSKTGSAELVFLDGNHRKEPTLAYFDQLIKYKTGSSLFIFDDIHWSKEMEEAWGEIKTDPRVTLTIDLFFFGLVFFTPAIKFKQDFVIRF